MAYAIGGVFFKSNSVYGDLHGRGLFFSSKTQKTEEKTMKNKNLTLGYYFGQHKLAIFCYILLYILAGACSIFEIIEIANAIELVTLSNFTGAITTFFIVVGLIFFKRICWYLTGLLYDNYSVKIMAELNSDLARQTFKLNSKTYSNHDTGTLVQRIVSDPERVVEKFADMVDIITDIVTATIMIIYITTLNIYVALILFGLLAVGFTLEIFRVKHKRRNSKKVRELNDKINSLTTEIIRSEKDIKSLGLENELSKVSDENYKSYRKAIFKKEFTDTNFWAIRNFIIQATGILILIFAITLMQADKSLLTLASFMIIYTNHDKLYGLIWGVGNVLNSVVDIKTSTNRMFSLFDEKEFVTEKFGNTKIDNIVGDVEFKNVAFTFRDYEYKYDKKTNKTTEKLVGEKRIFEDLSFRIPHNKTVAFVGKSGSGKSTILNLLSKMYDVDSGEVLIDGHNINSLDKETLRKTFSLVNQFPYIFDMTIKENLLLANNNATDDDIADVIKKASLEEFVSSLTDGVNTKVGESGMKLSGGQKQRLAIARALLRNSPVILFDESTSSLDNFAQNEVKKSIDELKGKSTIIIVAHRLSTIKDADIIFFLDEGKIVDKGTFEDLFTTNIKFKNMFLAENIN